MLETSDSSLPVVTFSKGNDADGIRSRYPAFRVQVFADRSAVYEGYNNVKLEGKHKYHLTPREYQALIRATDAAFAIADSHSPIYSRNFTLGSIALSTGAVFNFYFFGDRAPVHISLMRNIEKHLKTKALRCPAIKVIEGQPKDVCEVEDEIEDHVIKGRVQ